MKRYSLPSLGYSFAVLGFITLLSSQALAQAPNYAEYDRLTRQYVDARGLVNYAGLKTELGALKNFVEQFGAFNPDTLPNELEKLRYYLTSYNAWVLYHATKAYPAKSEMWNLLGLFRDHDIKLGGQPSTLEFLEHKIIRPRFKDPRGHFYLNCAAASCPALWQGAIPAGKTDEVLEKAARRFINDTRHVKFDPATKRLTISKIFDWFSGDFLDYLKTKRGMPQPHIAQYILIYLDSPAREALAQTPVNEIKVGYFSYNKSLNEQR